MAKRRSEDTLAHLHIGVGDSRRSAVEIGALGFGGFVFDVLGEAADCNAGIGGIFQTHIIPFIYEGECFFGRLAGG